MQKVQEVKGQAEGEHRVRDHSIDAVKGFAILLVMVGHCIILNNMQDGIVYDAIAAVQMPLFMAVSGYVAGMTLRIRDTRDLLRKLGKRAVQYLTPFFVWIFVLYPFWFFSRLNQVLFQLDLGLWFLMVLFLMTAALYTAVWARDCTGLKWAGFTLVLGVFCAGAVWQYLSGGTFLSPHLTVKYLPFFLGGYAVRLWKEHSRKGTQQDTVQAKGKTTAALLAAAVVFLLLVVRYDMVTAHSRAEWLLQMAASACGTAVCGAAVCGLRDGKGKRFLSFAGRYTLEIYVLHFHFARILGMDRAGLSLYSAKGMGVVLATFLLMSVITACLIVLLKRFKVTDFLLFGKASYRTPP